MNYKTFAVVAAAEVPAAGAAVVAEVVAAVPEVVAAGWAVVGWAAVDVEAAGPSFFAWICRTCSWRNCVQALRHDINR